MKCLPTARALPLRRPFILGALLATATLAACADRLLVSPAPARSQLLVSYSLAPTAAGMPGTAGAFDSADRLRVQLTRPAGESMDTILPFAATGDVTIVPLSITLTEEQEQATLAVELRRGTDVLFQGATAVVLQRADTTSVDLQLTPVPAGVRLPATIAALTTLGDTVRVVGAVIFATGDTITGLVPGGWMSTNAGVASVSQTGLVTALAEGQTEIRATYGTHLAGVPVQVAATVTQVTLQPGSQTIIPNQNVTYTATARDSRGNALSRMFVWTSSNPAAVTATPSGPQSAVVRGVAPGQALVTAAAGTANASVNITVAPPPVVNVTVAPATATLRIGQTTQLTATPRDSAGQPLTGRVVTWSSSDAAVAVSSTGLVTAVAAGQAVITATSEGRSGTATILVLDDVASVTVSPPSATVIIGGTAQFSAVARNAAGATITGRPVAWSTLNAGIATIDASSGLVLGVSAGQTTITATVDGVPGSAVVTVTDPQAPGTVRGRVLSATTNLPLPGASVGLAVGGNAPDGSPLVVSSTSASDGTFTLTAPPGTYTLLTTATGYTSARNTNLVIVSNQADAVQVFMSPTLPAGQTRIVLSWGATPADLDAHLFVPVPTGDHQVYYGDPGDLSNLPYAQLDVDVTQGFGPETITISQHLPGVYRYYVHNWSNQSDTASTALSASGATVTVYQSGGIVAQFSVPQGTGTWWSVFEMDGGFITPINTLDSPVVPEASATVARPAAAAPVKPVRR